MRLILGLLGILDIWLAILGFSFACPVSGFASAKTLAQVKPGTMIRTTQAINAAIPPILKPLLASRMVLVIQNGHALPDFLAQPTDDPVCLLGERTLEFKDPDSFQLPKSSLFVVKRAAVAKNPGLSYAGPMTELDVEAAPQTGMKLSGKFQCFAGKSGKTLSGPITIDAFEEVFARKIRVDSD